MPVAEAVNAPWTRKHDLPTKPLIARAPKILYPTMLEDVIEICSRREGSATRAPNQHLKAAGSHWALSEAAISDDLFIETNDPKGVFPAMGATLFEVIPKCMSDAALNQLAQLATPFDPGSDQPKSYALLRSCSNGEARPSTLCRARFGDDRDEDPPNKQNKASLAFLMAEKFNKRQEFFGSWAFKTLGGAGGQTVFGALTTGTHGGDVKLPPIAEPVRAMHLVVDGGKHFWIEPKSPPDLPSNRATDG